MLSASFGEVSLSLHLPASSTHSSGESGDAVVVAAVPMALLEAAEGSGTDTALIEADPSGKVRCRINQQGEPREAAFDVPVAGAAAVSTSSRRPRMRPAGDGLLAAIFEAGKTTSAAGVRFAFSRLQLKGKKGQVIATDGRQLLVWGGFELPFADDVLIPAVPVFGSRELASETNVRIGRAGPQILVEAGPWTIGLTIEEGARFPDVESVLARATGNAHLRIAAAEIEPILQAIERLARADKAQPAMILFGSDPVIVIGASKLPLRQSEVEGRSMATTVQAQHLLRALQMGLHELHADQPGGTVLFSDAHRSYLVTCPQADPAPPSSTAIARIPTAISEEGGHPVSSAKNGQTPRSETDEPEEVLDPLAEAEGLRVALAEAGRRTSRLVASLRHLHKQRRVFETAWSSLRHLGLGSKEEQ
jgi:hypothetical protein